MIARTLAVLMLAAGVGLWWARRADAAAMTIEAAPEGDGFTFYDLGPAVADVLPSLPEWVPSFGGFNEQVGAMSEAEAENNMAAFLRMIRVAEGTADADGYRRIFGGTLFDSFADHPRRPITAKLGGKSITSTAAGAYQFLSKTWDECARALGLPDFSPASQDAAAIYLIKRRGALDDVRAGRFDAAVRKVAKEWASLPGSPYGQPTISAERARDLYAQNGGVFA